MNKSLLSILPSTTWFDQNQTEYSVQDFTHGWVILYSYPKDNTPGCTRQACDLRDQWARWNQHQVKVFGVSPDSIDSHSSFASQYSLPFPLLSDPHLHICKALEIWGEQRWKNHTYMGLERSTWLFFEGHYMASFRQVSVSEHWDEVWEKWQELHLSLSSD